jgi:cyclopropane fatty-acyl-phospholipid synthase-like methyltransferase
MKNLHNETNLPNHLGGHCGITHVDNAILEYFKNQNCKTYLDIGCGPGGMLDAALELGFDVTGIDGDFTVERKNPEKIIIHDYTTGPLELVSKFDLVWSCEFVEHVYEEYLPNFMKTFQSGKIICMTYAPPKKKGYHHVNLKSEEYWIDIFQNYGFNFDKSLTLKLRKISSMGREFFREYGLVFIK